MIRNFARMLSLLALLSAGCAARRGADFVVMRTPAGGPLVGFGACADPYLYAYPNAPDEISPAAMADLEKKVKALHPRFVRVFFLQSWWDKDTDPVIAKNHPGMRESFIRTVRLAQESGAKVLIQFWYDPSRYKNPEAVAGRFAQSIAEMRSRYGMFAIQFATIQNEPNDDGKDITDEKYVRLYRALDKGLRDQGIRRDVEIVAGDLVYERQDAWIELIGHRLADVVDAYSIHCYWDYWDIDRFIRHVDKVNASLAKLPAKERRPVFVTEFGVQGFRDKPSIEPGKSADGKPLADVPVSSFEVGLFMIEAMNNGYLATAQWDLYEVWYDRKMGYGVIGSVQNGFPEKPGYSLLWLFAHSIDPGWHAARIKGNVEDVWVAAARGTGDDVTLVVANHEPGVREISVGGLPPGKPMHAWIWNWQGKGELSGPQDVRVDESGEVKIAGARLAITVLTSK